LGWTKKDTSSYGETIDWDDTPEFEGVFIGSKEIETKFGDNTVYRFEGDDGETYEAWGSAALNRGLEDVEKGDRVRIEYKGMAKGKGGKRSHQFDVYVSDGEDDDKPAAKSRTRKAAASKPAAKARTSRARKTEDEEAY
jgi:hypothetical protein